MTTPWLTLFSLSYINYVHCLLTFINKSNRHVVFAGALGWVKPIHRVVLLKLHKRTITIGHSLRKCTRHVDSPNPGQSDQLIKVRPIPEAEMSKRLIDKTKMLTLLY